VWQTNAFGKDKSYPAAFLTILYSTLGAGVIILPTGDPNDAVLKIFALDANGKASTIGFDTVFKGRRAG
jgi:hypothetical protein